MSPKHLALHVCCAPCMLEPYAQLVQEYEKITAVFFNPNIHPVEEYERRRSTFVEYVTSVGIDFEILEYEPMSWIDGVAHSETVEARCTACYQTRLGRVAQWAHDNGADCFTTTLTVSPYQNPTSISAAGQAAATQHGVEYVETDFSDLYQAGVNRSRELEMYRQNYCGCMLSDIEAREMRSAAKAVRKAAKGAHQV